MGLFTEELDLALLLDEEPELGENTTSDSNEINLFSWWDEVGGDISTSQQSSSSISTFNQSLGTPVHELDEFPWFEDGEDIFSMDFEHSKPGMLDQGVAGSPAQQNRVPAVAQKIGRASCRERV